MRDAAYGNATEAKQAAADGLKLVPTSQGVDDEAALAFAMAGDTARAESMAQDLNKRFPLDTQLQSLWLTAIHAQVLLDRKNPADAIETLQAAVPIEWDKFRSSTTSPASIQPTFAVKRILLRAKGTGSSRVSEDTGPSRHRVELLDRSASAPGRSACQCAGRKNLDGCGCRCCANSRAGCVQGFSCAVERRRPQHPHPEGSEGGIREAAIAGESSHSTLAVCRWFT